MKFPIRKVVNWLSLAIFLIAAYFLIRGEVIIALGYATFSVIIFLPRIVYRRLELHSHFSNEMLDWGEIIFSVTIVLSIAGYLWLFDSLFDYDVYVHFFSPLFLFIIIAVVASAIVQNYKLERVGKAEIILATLVIMVCLILLWELFEFAITKITGKDMFFDFGRTDDTLYDVLSGFLSLPLGSVIVYKYHDWLFDKLKFNNHPGVGRPLLESEQPRSRRLGDKKLKEKEVKNGDK